MLVSQHIGDSQPLRTRLPGTKKFARAALGEVVLSQLETILGRAYRSQTIAPLGRQGAAIHQHAAAPTCSPADSPPELMQLGESQSLCVFDDEERGIGYIQTNLDNRRGYQYVQLRATKRRQDIRLLGAGHPTMNESYAEVRQFVSQFYGRVDGRLTL